MVDEEGQPKPALEAFRFLTNELMDAVFLRELTEYSDLQGYEFQLDQKKVWVIWSPDGQAYPITLPPTVTKVMDLYGNEIVLNSEEYSIQRPVYVELSP